MTTMRTTTPGRPDVYVTTLFSLLCSGTHDYTSYRIVYRGPRPLSQGHFRVSVDTHLDLIQTRYFRHRVVSRAASAESRKREVGILPHPTTFIPPASRSNTPNIPVGPSLAPHRRKGTRCPRPLRPSLKTARSLRNRLQEANRSS